ncbi:F-box/kelch-repeat protein [Camellia lanceoleosa]|uniref:F-box/kelch-repeat protein n=1 Tax=Camellia lanceoleosa TaxID=1840588 RepID=A0ACC0GQ91_9ERIC|nr:F-box/kelch-repeat protein [Camellia lanceoleosa]
MMAKLPEEIIIDILLRLPVTSLCRFRCVSKPWLSLISDTYFIRTHLNRNTNNQKHPHDRLIIVSHPTDFHAVDLKSFQSRHDFEALHLKFPPEQKPSDCMEIWGSCDGLLLMLDDFSNCFLVNPSTRQSRKLPKSPFSINSSEYCCLDSFGFGYDSSNDHYKVVRISHHDYNYRVACADNIVSVYSLSTDSWRRIEDSPFDHSCYEPSPGSLLGGALHWVARTVLGSNKSTVIASLDLADESFHNVPCPAEFVFWDPLEKKSKELVIQGCPDYYDAETYVETLVSPNSSNTIKRSLQAQTEACEAKTKADLSKAKRSKPSSSKIDCCIL